MPGITVNDTPCWILTYDRDAEFEAHYDTEAKALEAAADDDEDNRGVPKRLDAPCAVAVTACGYRYDEDGDYSAQQHWPGPGDFRDHLLAEDFRFGVHGELLCPLDHDCEECNVVLVVVVPVELPGQMTISEVSTR